MQLFGVRLSVCPSVCVSVPSDICTPLLQICCCGPGGQELSIDCCSSGGRMRAVPRCQRTYVVSTDFLTMPYFQSNIRIVSGFSVFSAVLFMTIF